MPKNQTTKTVSAPTDNHDARNAVLEKAIFDITKRYGEGAIQRMGEASHMAIESISNRVHLADIALGIRRRIPYGRITEISSSGNSGSRTLVPIHCGQRPKARWGVAAYIDMEHALDPVYAATCGVDVDNLLISQPDTGEQALEIAETLVRSGRCRPGGCRTRWPLWSRGQRLKVIWVTIQHGYAGSPYVPSLAQAVRRHQPNQKLRLCLPTSFARRFGVMFGNPETTPGGLASKFYASVRLDVRRIQSIRSWDRSDGQPYPGSRRQEQMRRPVQIGRIRYHVRRKASPGWEISWMWRLRLNWSRSGERFSRTGTLGSDMGVKTQKNSCVATRS